MPLPAATKMLGVRIPDDLHRRVRSHAALEGKTVQAVVIELLEATVGQVGVGPKKR